MRVLYNKSEYSVVVVVEPLISFFFFFFFFFYRVTNERTRSSIKKKKKKKKKKSCDLLPSLLSKKHTHGERKEERIKKRPREKSAAPS
jgi:hypothetical protein